VFVERDFNRSTDSVEKFSTAPEGELT